MTDKYNKIGFKDHIVDSNGNVIQQGTPLSAANFDKMEKGIKDAQAMLAPEVAAAAAHSGVLNYEKELGDFYQTITDGAIGYSSGSSKNSIYLGPTAALIHGNVVEITHTNNELLDPPPATGVRYDAVFIEAWRDSVTQEWKTRLRTAAGVDFDKYPDGVGTYYNSSTGQREMDIYAQGGNASPLDYSDDPYDVKNTDYGFWYRGTYFVSTAASGNTNREKFENDYGIFVAGNGTEESKGILNTYDGYSYAIPVAKVERRNTGGFSQQNPDGARNYIEEVISSGTIREGETFTDTVSTEFYNAINVGEILLLSDGKPRLEVVSKGTDNVVTFKAVGGGFGGATMHVAADRPDGLYANRVAERDITDLRRRTDLKGYDYNNLLEEGYHDLLGGRMQVKEREKMLKTYHGVRKTPIDSNHIIHVSLDGKTAAEPGGAATVVAGGVNYKPANTGLGAEFDGNDVLEYSVGITGSALTVDYFLSVDEINKHILGFFNSEGAYTLWNQITTGGQLMANGRNGAGGSTYQVAGPVLELGRTYHVRSVFSDTELRLYVDGKLVDTRAATLDVSAAVATLKLGEVSGTSARFKGTMSDFSVSDVDRGDVFATLPDDVISGNAVIMPAFNSQRRILSDASVKQATTSYAKVANATQDREVTVTKGSGTDNTIWEAGDTIQVKGLAGELIDSGYTPDVKAYIDGTVTTVSGTWAGLDTDTATFTLGTLPAGLDTEDIRIKYTLSMDAGAGATIEPYTKLLAGEYNGHMLTEGEVAVLDDFAGKIEGSTVENPNIMYNSGTATELLAPGNAAWGETGQAGIDLHGKLDGDLQRMVGIANSGVYAQRLFKMDIIKIFAAKFPGFFDDTLTTAEKVQKIKDSWGGYVFNWYGYGIHDNDGDGVLNNKVTIESWYVPGATWAADAAHSNSYVSKLISARTNYKDYIDDSGFMYFLIHSEPSDGITSSEVLTDYVSIEVHLKEKQDYDILVPENPRRDAGAAGALYVRKYTKEVEAVVPGLDEDSGVVTYGDFVPYQGTAAEGLNVPVSGKYRILGNFKTWATSIGTGAKSEAYEKKYWGNYAVENQLPMGYRSHEYRANSNEDINNVEAVLHYDSEQRLQNDAFIIPYSVGESHLTLIVEEYGKRHLVIGENDKFYRGVKLGHSTSGFRDYIISYQLDHLKGRTDLLNCIVGVVMNEETNELMLAVSTFVGNRMEIDNHSATTPVATDLFRLAGRPLAKGVK